MQRTTAKALGFFVLVLGVAGLLGGEKQLWEFLNIDIPLDLARLALAALLLYAAYKGSPDLVRTSLIVFGVAYVGMAIAGISSSSLWGLLPHELSNFDKIFHLLAGLAVLGIAAKRKDAGPAEI